MADLTITISNRLSLLGGSQPTLWGNTGNTTMTWGSDNWGSDSEEAIQAVEKFFDDTLSLSELISDLTADFARTLENELVFSSDIVTAILGNGDWSYVFPGDVTNADDRISTTYTSPTDPSSAWSDPSHPSTVWS